MKKTRTTKTELCKALELDWSTVRFWWMGIRSPRLDAIEKALNYVGLEVVTKPKEKK